MNSNRALLIAHAIPAAAEQWNEADEEERARYSDCVDSGIIYQRDFPNFVANVASWIADAIEKKEMGRDQWTPPMFNLDKLQVVSHDDGKTWFVKSPDSHWWLTETFEFKSVRLNQPCPAGQWATQEEAEKAKNEGISRLTKFWDIMKEK